MRNPVLVLAIAFVVAGCVRTRYVEVPVPVPQEVLVPVVVPDILAKKVMVEFLRGADQRESRVAIMSDSLGPDVKVRVEAGEDPVAVVKEELYWLHETLSGILAWFRIRVGE